MVASSWALESVAQQGWGPPAANYSSASQFPCLNMGGPDDVMDTKGRGQLECGTDTQCGLGALRCSQMGKTGRRRQGSSPVSAGVRSQ